jgi:hypothetical protein
MALRVAAFLAACLVGGASVSLTVCEVLCASHEQRPAHHAEHHSCAPSGATTISIAGVPHICGHDEADDVAVVQASDIPLTPAVAPFIAWWPASDGVMPGAIFLAPAEYSPPGLLEKATQLRV